jgi:predicted SAM-dependent methyltransferase
MGPPHGGPVEPVGDVPGDGLDGTPESRAGEGRIGILTASSREGVVRLHLGCGPRIFPGFLNIDGFDDHADLKADIRKLPFPDNHADLIVAIHVFEHFEQWEAVPIAMEWLRVLKPGGVLIMEMPDLDKVRHLLDSTNIRDTNLALLGLYGDWSKKRPEMTHKWCYSGEMLQGLLSVAGYRQVAIREPEFHVERRDLRVVAVK